jgi:hypothetical protein
MSTVTATVTPLGLTTIFGLLVAVLLVVLLIAKEIAASTEGEQARRWRRVLTVGMAPLVVSTLVIVIVQLSRLF